MLLLLFPANKKLFIICTLHTLLLLQQKRIKEFGERGSLSRYCRAEPSRAEPLDDAEWILDRFSSFKREGRIGVGYYRALVIYYLSMMCLEEDQPAVGNVKEGEKQQQQQQQRRHGRRGRRRCLFSSPPRRLLHPLYVID